MGRRDEARKQAAELACWLGLDGGSFSIGRRRSSGGQQQRVAIGRALISQPRLVLLDEPLASLDALSKQEFYSISWVLRERRASAVYVTHDPNEATLLCDQVAFIYRGRLHQVAPPNEAYRNPATLFVARMFSGFSNCIPCTIDADGIFTLERSSASLNVKALEASYVGSINTKLWLAGRTEDFRIGSLDFEGLPGTVIGRFSFEGCCYARVEIRNGYDDFLLGWQ